MAEGIQIDPFYEKITQICEQNFLSGGSVTTWELVEKCMDIDDMPVHFPTHHYIMPAVLLTMCHKEKGNSFSSLQEDLSTALSRAKNVLGGFCGWYGACGSCVGVGIFMSIFTKTDPYSKESWSWTNRATADALTSISGLNGPRCCKRNTYLALEAAHKSISNCLGIQLDKPETVKCKYNKGNKECQGKRCSFFVPK